MSHVFQITSAVLAFAVIMTEYATLEKAKKGTRITVLSILILASSIAGIARESQESARDVVHRTRVRTMARVAFEDVLDDYISILVEGITPGFVCEPGNIHCEEEFFELRHTFEPGGRAAASREVKVRMRASAIRLLSQIDGDSESASTVEIPSSAWAKGFEQTQLRLERLLQVHAGVISSHEFESAELLRLAQYPRLIQAIASRGIDRNLMTEFGALGYVDGQRAFAKFVSSLETLDIAVSGMPIGFEDIAEGRPYN